MSKPTYFYTATGVFLVVGTLHLVRAVNGWETTIAGANVPASFSWAIAIVAAYLVYRGFHFAR